MYADKFSGFKKKIITIIILFLLLCTSAVVANMNTNDAAFRFGWKRRGTKNENIRTHAYIYIYYIRFYFDVILAFYCTSHLTVWTLLHLIRTLKPLTRFQTFAFGRLTTMLTLLERFIFLRSRTRAESWWTNA